MKSNAVIRKMIESANGQRTGGAVKQSGVNACVACYERAEKASSVSMWLTNGSVRGKVKLREQRAHVVKGDEAVRDRRKLTEQLVRAHRHRHDAKVGEVRRFANESRIIFGCGRAGRDDPLGAPARLGVVPVAAHRSRRAVGVQPAREALAESPFAAATSM
eukprot:7116050-Prymnesium_polylepis.1